MNLARSALITGVVLLAVTAQVAVFSLFSVNGVVPDLALIVVVAASIARGPQFGAVIGFVAGLLVDRAPPADHVAGRWALALVVVAILAGRVRNEARSNPLAGLATVAVCSFVFRRRPPSSPASFSSSASSAWRCSTPTPGPTQPAYASRPRSHPGACPRRR